MSHDPAVAAATALVRESVPVDDFLTWTEWSLARVGFVPSNCLAIVGVCRDELMSGFDQAVAGRWGHPFQAGALAGLVFVGRTGLQAALGHVPGEDGRHRFVAFCMPHVGIDADGTVGRVQRRGMHRDSAACGALVAFRDDLSTGRTTFELDPEDVEQSLLSMRLGGMVDPGRTPSLLDLTELARRAAVEDMRRFVDLARGREPVDVAYLSGIVVHLPDGVDHVASVEAHVVIDGEVIDLPH